MVHKSYGAGYHHVAGLACSVPSHTWAAHETTRGTCWLHQPASSLIMPIFDTYKLMCVIMTAGLNKYSSRITQPKSQGASQAMLYATGGWQQQQQ